MRILKYRKITILIAFYVLALLLSPLLGLFVDTLSTHLGVVTALVLGYMYSFSFTSGAAAVMLFDLADSDLWFVTVAALGSTLADITIYKIFKIEFAGELGEFMRSPRMQKFFTAFPFLRKTFWRNLLGIVALGSPLPDELGMLALAQSKLIRSRWILLIVFIVDFIGIYTLSVLGK